ncbi:unnamed protein product [Dicrocoelium dendriticum]|nr:unnamed protein product [Dicrocoelium dendriticum]
MLFDNACADIHQLENELLDMEAKYEATCQMLNEALGKVAEVLQLTKVAADERDEALEAKILAERKLESLQDVVENLLEEAGKRTQEEVEKVREQANTNIAKLLDELQSVEKERSRLYLQLNRGKQNSDARTLTDEGSSSKECLEQRITQALQRARQAETERDDLRLKLELSQVSQERLLSEKRNETQRLLDEQKLLETRLRNMEAQRSAMEEKVRHYLEAANTAERRLTEFRQKSENTQRSALQQVLIAHQSAELHDAEYRKRIEIIERVAQQSTQRWRELLGAQQKVALKWKTEAYTLADQLEKQGKTFQTEISRSREETARLSKRLQKVNRKRAFKVEAQNTG